MATQKHKKIEERGKIREGHIEEGIEIKTDRGERE